MPLDVPFDYEITRSQRKSLAIYIRNGRADVRAPLRAPKKWIEEFLHERHDWVVKQIEEQQRKAAESFILADGAEILYLGEPVRVRLTNDNRRGVQLCNERLSIPANDLFGSSSDYFHAWLQQQAQQYITPRAEALAAELAVAERLREIRFRKTRSQWGYCSSKGVVQYNWLIMLAPVSCIEYLIAHEICHLRHMNHSKTYWDLVESVCPHYRASRRWIKANEHRLFLL